MIHGEHRFSGIFLLLSWTLSDSFGVFLLIADAISIVYVLSSGPVQRRVYWTTLVLLVSTNLMMLVVDRGFWVRAMTGVAPPTAGAAPLRAYNILSTPAMLVFFAAPWLRDWRKRRLARRIPQ